MITRKRNGHLNVLDDLRKTSGNPLTSMTLAIRRSRDARYRHDNGSGDLRQDNQRPSRKATSIPVPARVGRSRSICSSMDTFV